MKKLVELNGEYGGWLQIDPVRLKRVATEFKAWLLKVDPNKDKFNFLGKDLPIVEGVLNGSIELPYRGGDPHNWEVRENLLPDDYLQISASFYNTIEGSLYEPPQVIMEDGRYFAWTEWDDPEQ
jgi:hypothetical protein